MVKLVHSDTHLAQKNNGSRDFNPKLRLVVSNPDQLPIQEQSISNAGVSSCFTVEVITRGPNLYEMKINDSPYGLCCELILEVEEGFEESGYGAVVCHFPNIQSEQLKEIVEDDETLFGMIMIQFQMQILEQLFMFCANHYSANLIIFVDDAQANDLEIYKDFLIDVDQTITPQGEKTEMVIPADRETFDQWIDFMADVNVKFKQTLWREQKNNPAVREYLTRHS